MTADIPDAVDHLRETLAERRTVFAGRLLTVHDDTVRLPGGDPARREIVSHRGAVAIVAVADDGRVVLVRQWRHAVGGAVWEVPAGTREDGEAEEATARRELAEETGYTARRWSLLGSGAVSPGYSSEIVTVFLARGLVPGAAATEPDERTDVALFVPAEAAALTRTGDTDLKTVAALALAGLIPDGAAVTR